MFQSDNLIFCPSLSFLIPDSMSPTLTYPGGLLESSCTRWWLVNPRSRQTTRTISSSRSSTTTCSTRCGWARRRSPSSKVSCRRRKTLSLSPTFPQRFHAEESQQAARLCLGERHLLLPIENSSDVRLFLWNIILFICCSLSLGLKRPDTSHIHNSS